MMDDRCTIYKYTFIVWHKNKCKNFRKIFQDLKPMSWKRQPISNAMKYFIWNTNCQTQITEISIKVIFICINTVFPILM